MRALNFRRDHSELFRLGRYLPLEASRGKEEHVVAFARQHAGQMSITAVPRLSLTLMKGREEPPIGAVWGDTELLLPPQAAGKRWRNILTDEVLTGGQSLLCREVFASFPVALLALD